MVIYIKELDKNDKIYMLDKIPKIIYKLVLKFIEISGYFFIHNLDEEKQVFIIPDINNMKVYKKIKKVINKKVKKTKRKIEVVLSEKLHELIYMFDGIKILDGRKIYIDNIEFVIKKIIGESPMEIQDIYILSNSYNSSNVNIINKLATDVKSINIITKDITKYSIIEDILIEKGIVITVSNNKKKSLKKAKLIVNLDFTDEEIRKYSIYRNACIINLNNNYIKKMKCFEGIIINNIDIKFPKEKYKYMELNNLISKFRKIELFESLNVETKSIVIETLYGNNGKINEKDLQNVKKILTK